MRRTSLLLRVLLLLSPGILRAEVYTIDFNRGTASGSSGNYVALPSDNAASFCHEGAEHIAGYSFSSCFYRSTGCGIRIGKLNGTGQAYIVFTLSEEIQSHSIAQIVVYASRGTNADGAEMGVYAGTNTATCSFSFADMTVYAPSAPESSTYILPEIIVDRRFKMLKVAARNTNFVVLHRIDIHTWDDEDALCPPRILSDGMGILYNMKGQRIGQPLPGKIYIRDGRKCILK